MGRPQLCWHAIPAHVVQIVLFSCGGRRQLGHPFASLSLHLLTINVPQHLWYAWAQFKLKALEHASIQ